MPTRTVELAIGERPHRLTFENPGEAVPDGDGGYIEGWTPLATVWGKVAPASAADLEKVIAGTVTALNPFLVVVPYLPGVTTTTRMLFHGRSFAVMGVRNVDERNIRLELLCEERVSTEGEEAAGAVA